MSNELAVKYEADGLQISLNPSIVMGYMLNIRQGDSVPQKELAKVISTCQARKLNPFTGDVVVTPHKDRDGNITLSIVTTKDFFTRRAEANPKYKGKEAGIVVLTRDKRPIRRPGSSVYKSLGEVLLGGYCKVFVEGREPEYAEVSLDEYDQKQALWRSKPATMIRKVAVSQALREAFPNEFNGLYEPEEMGIDEERLKTPEIPLEEVAELINAEEAKEEAEIIEAEDMEEF